MKKTAALVLMACSLSACDTSVDPRPSATRPQALLMINGLPSSLNGTVNTLYNGLVALMNANEISPSVASALGKELAEIKSDPANYRDMSATSALGNLNNFVQLVNKKYPAEITLCAQVNLVRGAQFVIDAINWSVANGGAVRPADLTLPWGVCPMPLPVSNLTVTNNGNTAVLSFYYAPNANYFWIFQKLRNGSMAQLLGMIDSNDGVPGGDAAPTGGTRSFTVPTTPDANLTIIVRVCGGLHCADVTVSAGTTSPAVPLAPATLTGTSTSGGMQLAWPAVAGADQYRVYRNGVLLQTLGAGSTSYTDGTAVAGTTYLYEVESCNALGCSSTKVSVSVTVQDPSCHVGGNNRDKNKCKSNNGNQTGDAS